MEEIDIKSIVKAYLVTHGYDGLYEPYDNGCACVLSDLMPCDQPHQSCKPGHVISYNGDDGFVWSHQRCDEDGFVIG